MSFPRVSLLVLLTWSHGPREGFPARLRGTFACGCVLLRHAGVERRGRAAGARGGLALRPNRALCPRHPAGSRLHIPLPQEHEQDDEGRRGGHGRHPGPLRPGAWGKGFARFFWPHAICRLRQPSPRSRCISIPMTMWRIAIRRGAPVCSSRTRHVCTRLTSVPPPFGPAAPDDGVRQ